MIVCPPVVGSEIRRFDRVASTNDLARVAANEGAPGGLVITAESQTRGRGRLGRPWQAPPSSALLLSVLLRPCLAPSQLHLLVQVTGLALCKTLRSLGLQPRLKWPNDVLLHSKKCAGILIEAGVQEGALLFAVVGIGLNVNAAFDSDPSLAASATSLALEQGHPLDRTAVEQALLTNLDLVLRRLDESDRIRLEYHRELDTLGRWVQAAAPAGPVEGWAEDVTRTGELIVLGRDGTRVLLSAGDVTLSSCAPVVADAAT